MTGTTNFFDVIIIGGGPAGMSAVLWSCDLGLTALVLEKESEFGGQLLRIHDPVKNYLGIDARNGAELCNEFRNSIERLEFSSVFNANITSVDLRSKTVRLDEGTEFSANAIVIATGVRRRKLGIEGEKEFRGKGILESGAKERKNVEDKRVVIVGGGDAALENALMLSEYAAAVTVVHRRAEFTARPDFLDRAMSTANIEILTDTIVHRIVGKNVVEAVELASVISSRTELRPADNILIRIGVQPNTGLFSGQINLNTAGYITVNNSCETSIDGVFAAGDVANPIAPTISTAAGTGAAAVKNIRT